MALFREEDVTLGFDIAEQRVEEFGWALSPTTQRAVRDTLGAVLREYPEPLSRRFVVLFSELTAVAAAARQTYRHSMPQQSDMEEFLKETLRYMNSFSHDEP